MPTDHSEEVDRLATLLREIADEIEDKPNRVEWDEDRMFTGRSIPELDLYINYRGPLASLTDPHDDHD